MSPLRRTSRPVVNDCALRKTASIVITLALCWFSGGCATRPPTSPPKPPPTATHETGWWTVRFEIQWPEQQSPPWHMDALLADKVINPALLRYRQSIDLWRFHRRAARDSAGHRFSFIFYSSATTAYEVFKLIKNDPLFGDLLSSHRIEHVDFDDLATTDLPDVEDTSDSSWPPLIRKSWPKFIMGASEMWLELIHGLAEMEITSGEPLGNDEALYRRVHDKLGELWKHQGQHPFLHHLNALFGYEEMMVINRNGTATRF